MVTRRLREYCRDKAINIAGLARRANIPEQALYDSLSKSGTRKIKADELLSICKVLEIDPMIFAD